MERTDLDSYVQSQGIKLDEGFRKTLESFFGIDTPVKAEEEPSLVKCPRSDKCISVCGHREPHEKDRHCEGGNGDDPMRCPACVDELKADCTFFPEEFEL